MKNLRIQKIRKRRLKVFWLFVLMFAVSILVMVSILKFPSLRKVSWKPIIALVLITRALDIAITLMVFLRVGHAEYEVNLIIRKLYHWVGFNNLFLFLCILVGAAMALGFAWLIKILITSKDETTNLIGYHLGYFLIVSSFIAFINNCIVFSLL